MTQKMRGSVLLGSFFLARYQQATARAHTPHPIPLCGIFDFADSFTCPIPPLHSNPVFYFSREKNLIYPFLKIKLKKNGEILYPLYMFVI